MNKSKAIAVLTLIVSLLLSLLFFIYRDFFKSTVSLGLLWLFMINLSASSTIFVPVPAFVAVVAAGGIYPSFLVALAASLGSTIGEGLSFVFGIESRTLAFENLARKHWFRVVDRYFEKYGFWSLFIFSFVPNPLFDAVGLVAGVLKYSPFKFFLVVFLGRFLRFYLFAKFAFLLWR